MTSIITNTEINTLNSTMNTIGSLILAANS
jgi:hypothetical protein